MPGFPVPMYALRPSLTCKRYSAISFYYPSAAELSTLYHIPENMSSVKNLVRETISPGLATKSLSVDRVNMVGVEPTLRAPKARVQPLTLHTVHAPFVAWAEVSHPP